MAFLVGARTLLAIFFGRVLLVLELHAILASLLPEKEGQVYRISLQLKEPTHTKRHAGLPFFTNASRSLDFLP